jgi:hypothetical protein
MGYPPGYTPPTGGGVVAWEDSSQGFFGRWWTTVREVSFNPRVFFGAASQNDNPWPAITFAMSNAAFIGLVLGGLIAIFYIGFGGLGMLAAMGSGGKGSGGAGAAIFGMMGAIGVFAAILYPVMLMIQALIGPWIIGGLQHLTLMLVGGATKSYTHSVRVVGYGWASYFWILVPCVGPFIWLIIMAISLTVGHDETHKCGIGKALVAVFGIPLLCMCCYFILGFAMAAAGN